MNARVPTRDERQAATRHRLLAAAARVFAAKGFHGAAVSLIASEAGHTTGALYANFESKERLFLEMIDRQLARQADELETIGGIADPDVMRARFRGRVEQLMSGLTDPGDLFAAAGDGEELSVIQVQTLTLEFLLYAVRERPDLHRAIAERYQSVETRLSELFRRWLEAEGVDSAIGADELAKVQSWIVEGLGLRLLQDPGHIDAARAADLYLTLITDLPLRPPRDPIRSR